MVANSGGAVVDLKTCCEVDHGFCGLPYPIFALIHPFFNFPTSFPKIFFADLVHPEFFHIDSLAVFYIDDGLY